MEMYTLGPLVLGVPALPATEAVRVARYRWSARDRAGAAPGWQWLGPGEDKLTLSGVSLLMAVGRDDAVDALRDLAAAGEARPLADGAGRVLGSWAIRSVEERRRNLRADGTPAVIEWRLELALVEPPRGRSSLPRPSPQEVVEGSQAAAQLQRIELLEAPVKQQLAERVSAVDRARQAVRRGLSWREALQAQVGSQAVQVEALLDKAGLKGLPRRLWGPEQLLALQPALPGQGALDEIREVASA